MNENNNRVNAVIPGNDFADIIAAIVSLDGLLTPFAIGLSAAEREAMPKINVSNRAFVQDALYVMGTPSAAAFIPAFLSAAPAQADLGLFDQLDQVYTALQPVLQKIVDTRTLAGSEAYTTALAFYKMAQAAASAGIPGAQAAADTLRERFAGNGGSGNGGGSGNNGGGNSTI